MKYHSVIKKKILPFVITWMDPGGMKLNETGQTEKGKYLMISLISGLQPTKQINPSLELQKTTNW